MDAEKGESDMEPRMIFADLRLNYVSARSIATNGVRAHGEPELSTLSSKRLREALEHMRGVAGGLVWCA